MGWTHEKFRALNMSKDMNLKCIIIKLDDEEHIKRIGGLLKEERKKKDRYVFIVHLRIVGVGKIGLD